MGACWPDYGLYGGSPYKTQGILWANVLVGILAAIGGGWCFVYLFGATEKMVYASLLVALGVSVLFLWILSKLKGKSR